VQPNKKRCLVWSGHACWKAAGRSASRMRRGSAFPEQSRLPIFPQIVVMRSSEKNLFTTPSFQDPSLVKWPRLPFATRRTTVTDAMHKPRHTDLRTPVIVGLGGPPRAALHFADSMGRSTVRILVRSQGLFNPTTSLPRTVRRSYSLQTTKR